MLGAGHEHLILERGRSYESWRSQRWDSLRVQQPNWDLGLPGHRYSGVEPDGFSSCAELLAWFDRYEAQVKPPLRCGAEVRCVSRASNNRWLVETSEEGYLATDVVIATGWLQLPRIPEYARRLPGDIVQIHSSQYRNAAQFPDGAVLVVGSGSSGFQIAKDLLDSGRKVHFSVGPHHRVPRRYRGRDFVWWWKWLGELDLTIDQVQLPETQVGTPLALAAYQDVDLRALERAGARLLGRARSADSNGRIVLAADLEESLAIGDKMYSRLMDVVDEQVVYRGLDAPIDELKNFQPPEEVRQPPTSLDVRAENVSGIVWATGFSRNYEFIKAPVADAAGKPFQRRGVSRESGLYFLGLQWQHKLSSNFISGVGEDAEYLAGLLNNGGAPTETGEAE